MSKSIAYMYDQYILFLGVLWDCYRVVFVVFVKVVGCSKGNRFFCLHFAMFSSKKCFCFGILSFQTHDMHEFDPSSNHMNSIEFLTSIDLYLSDSKRARAGCIKII